MSSPVTKLTSAQPRWIADPVPAEAAMSALTTFRMVSSRFFVWSSDEGDRFGHLQDSADFGQRALEIRFGRGRAEAKPDAETFVLHAPQRAGRGERDPGLRRLRD